MKTTFGFSRRGPDRVTEELAAALLDEKWVEFKALFTVVYSKLRARNAASGGEEMLRLRTYEKLQTLVQSGIVKKNAKLYKGIASSLNSFIEQLNATQAASNAVAASRAAASAAAAAPAPAAVQSGTPATKKAKPRSTMTKKKAASGKTAPAQSKTKSTAKPKPKARPATAKKPVKAAAPVKSAKRQPKRRV